MRAYTMFGGKDKDEPKRCPTCGDPWDERHEKYGCPSVAEKGASPDDEGM